MLVLDFPQIISVHHPDAKFYFDRDVQCIRTLFKSRFGINVVEYPEFHKVNIPPPLKPIKPRTNSLSEEQRLIRELEELTLHDKSKSEVSSSSCLNETCSNDSVSLIRFLCFTFCFIFKTQERMFRLSIHVSLAESS
jgi:RIO kinase 2